MDRWKLPDGLSKVVVASSPVGATCTDSFGTWPGEPRGCLTPDACPAARQEFDGDYDHGWDHGYAAAISHVRTRLGLSPDSTHEQVLDAVRGVRQAHLVRYESVPPPGWIVTSDGWWARTKKSVSPARRTEAWEVYEREHGYAPPAAEVKAETVTFAVGDWVTVPVDTKVPNIDKVIRAGTIGEVLLVGGSPENGEEIHVSFASDQCWWMTASTLQKTAKANRAPTYAEVLEAAAAAKREIEAEWPAWKKAIR